MTAYARTTTGRKSPKERCDTRVWSGECEHGDYSASGDKYLCKVCGTIEKLDHEVNHEVYPHVSGDYDNMS